MEANDKFIKRSFPDIIDAFYLPRRVVVYSSGEEAEWERILNTPPDNPSFSELPEELITDSTKRAITELPGSMANSSTQVFQEGEPPLCGGLPGCLYAPGAGWRVGSGTDSEARPGHADRADDGQRRRRSPAGCETCPAFGETPLHSKALPSPGDSAVCFRLEREVGCGAWTSTGQR